MNNVIGATLLIAIALLLSLIAVCQPQLTSDNNSFLREFVGQELLSVLGFIVAITAASASSVHLELRRLEFDYKYPNGFASTRSEVKRGAFGLLFLFLGAFTLVIIKPIVANNEHVQALINGAAIVIVVWNILVLIALLQLAFKVGPISLDEE